jgi:hypothetical protein
MISHDELIALLRHYQSIKPATHLVELFLEEDSYLCRAIFSNYREGAPGEGRGLRLSAIGLSTFQLFFQSWEVHLPEDYIVKSRHVLYLDNITTMPWYLDGPQLILFESELAMRAKLVGDLDSLISAFVIKNPGLI